MLDDGAGKDDPLHLVLEVKGQRDAQDDAKHDTMARLWVPSVNGAGRWGRWSFLRLDSPYNIDKAIRDHLAGQSPRPHSFALVAA